MVHSSRGNSGARTSESRPLKTKTKTAFFLPFRLLLVESPLEPDEQKGGLVQGQGARLWFRRSAACRPHGALLHGINTRRTTTPMTPVRLARFVVRRRRPSKTPWDSSPLTSRPLQTTPSRRIIKCALEARAAIVFLVSFFAELGRRLSLAERVPVVRPAFSNFPTKCACQEILPSLKKKVTTEFRSQH